MLNQVRGRALFLLGIFQGLCAGDKGNAMLGVEPDIQFCFFNDQEVSPLGGVALDLYHQRYVDCSLYGGMKVGSTEQMVCETRLKIARCIGTFVHQRIQKTLVEPIVPTPSQEVISEQETLPLFHPKEKTIIPLKNKREVKIVIPPHCSEIKQLESGNYLCESHKRELRPCSVRKHILNCHPKNSNHYRKKKMRFSDVAVISVVLPKKNYSKDSSQQSA